jgi:hypothetical protein
MELSILDPIRPPSLSINSSNSNGGGSNSSLVVTPTISHTDLPYTVGNTARRDDGALLYREILERRDTSEFLTQHTQQRRQQWESNYKEAAIFLEVTKVKHSAWLKKCRNFYLALKKM